MGAGLEAGVRPGLDHAQVLLAARAGLGGVVGGPTANLLAHPLLQPGGGVAGQGGGGPGVFLLPRLP